MDRHIRKSTEVRRMAASSFANTHWIFNREWTGMNTNEARFNLKFILKIRVPSRLPLSN
jgi:hypothetical protein